MRSSPSIRPSANIVTTRLLQYQPVCVDIRPIRTIHALEHSPCITDPKLGLNGADCRAIHYGLCAPLTQPPVVQITTNQLSTLTPIVAKLDTYRDKIHAAIELLAVEEEPADLETLLRNFVLEDRRRQEAKQLSTNELDSKKKIKIKSQPQIDLLKNQHNEEDKPNKVIRVRVSPKGSNEEESGSESLVQKRLSKFNADKQIAVSSGSLSSTQTQPSSSLLCPQSSLSSVELSSPSVSSQEKTVFGISPKSTSLTRYKKSIETRQQNASPPPLESDDSKDTSKDVVKQRTIIVKSNTPVLRDLKIERQQQTQQQTQQPQQTKQSLQTAQKSSESTSTGAVVAAAAPSAPSQPLASVVAPQNTTLASAPTLSVTDSKCVHNTPTDNSSSAGVQSNVLQKSIQMPPSPVKTLSASPSSTANNQFSLLTKTEIKQKNGKNRPLSAPESSMEQFIAQQLTDDEKVLIQRTSRKTCKDDQQLTVKSGNNGNKANANGNSTKPKPANDKPKPRIITLHKPMPKPDAKSAEPKFVNGKLVFGQVSVKPFLSKGSVAERVLLFEKCPEKTSVSKVKVSDTNKTSIKMTHNKLNQWMKTTNDFKQQNELTFQRRFSRSNSLNGSCIAGALPRFYYPLGRPYSSHEVEMQIKRISSVFDRFPSKSASRKEFGTILKISGLPIYWKEPLFRALNNNTGTYGSNNKKAVITCDAFVEYWKKVISTCYDEASRFLKILTRGERNYFLPEDFVAMIQDVIDSHPGLAFLKEAEEFHSRYVHTVIARIFYCVNKSWSGRISLPEMRKSNFLQVVSLLEDEDDINQITDYFSYEHFYVIYCKFWELDKDHDLFISKSDLNQHNDSAISSRMLDRIFSGAVTRGTNRKDGKMSYSEFVWFLLSEEDKRHPRSIEYWFRCMDLDGDGYLSMYELEYFYSEQIKRMEAIGIEALPFNDCLCQMLDLVRPKERDKISLADLKRCRLTPLFFDTFFNLEKYLDHEQRDPFASSRDEGGLAMSDWDRFAAEEYEILVAEENEQNNSNLLDFTGECGTVTDFAIAAKRFGLRAHIKDDDDYDYVDSDSDYYN